MTQTTRNLIFVNATAWAILLWVVLLSDGKHPHAVNGLLEVHGMLSAIQAQIMWRLFGRDLTKALVWKLGCKLPCRVVWTYSTIYRLVVWAKPYADMLGPRVATPQGWPPVTPPAEYVRRVWDEIE